jgi:hypothetical protein
MYSLGNSVYCRDQFKQFFMFRPSYEPSVPYEPGEPLPGSIWVTLGVATWSWSGRMHVTTPPDWVWDESPSFQHSQSIDGSTEFPEWRWKKQNVISE